VPTTAKVFGLARHWYRAGGWENSAEDLIVAELKFPGSCSKPVRSLP
jgi:hypothetical protein